MDMQTRRERAELFARYIGLELKGAIVSRGRTAQDVAEAVGRSSAGFNRWLNGKRELPITVLCEVAELLDMDPRVIVEHAYDRVVDELGERDDEEMSEGGATVTELRIPEESKLRGAAHKGQEFNEDDHTDI
ncbi:helix-turn-helix domain-containing protein [Pseudoclavibacter helvolus]|uniref:Transcriptional regulator with XRE-family HTH domain n=1 Tax=Pseudoclavibacter helvolus TaxID=255205 RepID=A0A7W4UM66_9MICO|nr:helix-turn-helix transcriptional regulator [Pseudoclavibacter helvolus]MBB2957009.1 transcriptional regulator with XRE-family HTH domain [Pseudoclavibacter helvolus]